MVLMKMITWAPHKVTNYLNDFWRNAIFLLPPKWSTNNCSSKLNNQKRFRHMLLFLKLIRQVSIHNRLVILIISTCLNIHRSHPKFYPSSINFHSECGLWRNHSFIMVLLLFLILYMHIHSRKSITFKLIFCLRMYSSNDILNIQNGNTKKKWNTYRMSFISTKHIRSAKKTNVFVSLLLFTFGCLILSSKIFQ